MTGLPILRSPAKITHQPGAARKPTRHPCLTLADADRMADAWQFAIDEGLPLNTFVSINWKLAPSPVPVTKRISALLDALHTRYRRRLRAHFDPTLAATEFAWIGVRENPPRGEGYHLFTHQPEAAFPDDAPPETDIYNRNSPPPARKSSCDRELARFIRKQIGAKDWRAVDVRRVGRRWFDRRDYSFKGGDPKVRSKYRTERFRYPDGTTKRHQGVIFGWRHRISQSLGPTAQDRAKARDLVTRLLRTAA
jgi:hypothetical protein